MSIWTINGQVAAAAGVKNIAMVFRNMVPDEATIVQGLDFETSGVFASIGETATIQRDGVTVFKGPIGAERRSAASSSEMRYTPVRGAWYWAEKFVYGQTNTYDSVTQYSSRVMLGGNLSAAVTSLLDFMQGVSGKWVRGTVDLPTITVPQSELRNVTVAQALQTLLRWVPGAVVTFDYSTTVPTCHVVHALGAQMQTVTVNWPTSSQTAAEYTKPDEMAVPNVILQYERASARRTEAYSVVNNAAVSTATETTGYDYVGIDQYPVGGVHANTVQLTTLLNGSKRRRTVSYVQPAWTTKKRSLTSYQTQNNVKFLLPAYPSWVVDGTYSASWTGSMSNLSGNSGAPDWSKIYDIPDAELPPKELWRNSGFNDGFEVWNQTFDITLTQTIGGSNVLRAQVTKTFVLAYSPVTGAKRDGQTIAREYNENDQALEAMPASGTAKQVYDALQVLSASGRLTLPGSEPAILAPKARKLVVPGLYSGVIQEVAVDVAAGQTVLTYGGPTHLAPQDIIELIQMWSKK